MLKTNDTIMKKKSEVLDKFWSDFVIHSQVVSMEKIRKKIDNLTLQLLRRVDFVQTMAREFKNNK